MPLSLLGWRPTDLPVRPHRLGIDRLFSLPYCTHSTTASMSHDSTLKSNPSSKSHSRSIIEPQGTPDGLENNSYEKAIMSSNLSARSKARLQKSLRSERHVDRMDGRTEPCCTDAVFSMACCWFPF